MQGLSRSRSPRQRARRAGEPQADKLEERLGGRGDQKRPAKDTVVLEEYEDWLRARGVSWDPRVRLRPPAAKASDGAGPRSCAAQVSAGWGLACLQPVARGEVVMRVPRGAAFAPNASFQGAEGGDGSPASSTEKLKAVGVPEDLRSFHEDRDCQLPLATALLWARHAGPGSTWWPKLSPEMMPRVCPLAWAPVATAGSAATALGASAFDGLRGTELEQPVASKLRRLHSEFVAARGALPDDCSLSDYIEACAVVMSRIQPWWGGSLVPLVDQANHTWGTPHVEFRRRGQEVVGRACRRIAVGEVFQSYGELSTADSLYRYGFVPSADACSKIRALPGDCVSIDAGLLVRAAIAATQNSDEHSEAHASTKEHVPSERLPLLLQAGLIEESAWDGVDDICGVELTVQDGPTRATSGGSVAEALKPKDLAVLQQVMALLLLPEEAWAEASRAWVEGGKTDAAATAAVKMALQSFGAQAATGQSAHALALHGQGQAQKLTEARPEQAGSKARLAAVAALRLRDAQYPGGDLASDEAAYDAAMLKGLAEDVAPAVVLGYLRVRIVERRLLRGAVLELRKL